MLVGRDDISLESGGLYTVGAKIEGYRANEWFEPDNLVFSFKFRVLPYCASMEHFEHYCLSILVKNPSELNSPTIVDSEVST